MIKLSVLQAPDSPAARPLSSLSWTLEYDLGQAVPIHSHSSSRSSSVSCHVSSLIEHPVPISIAISVLFLVIAFSVNANQDNCNEFKRSARVAAIREAESNSEKYRPSSWTAKKSAACLAFFFWILGKWLGTLILHFVVAFISWMVDHTPRPIRRFFAKFPWWRLKRSAKRLRRAARKRGLWKKEGSSESDSMPTVLLRQGNWWMTEF